MDDLVLVGIGDVGFGLRPPTDEEIAAYEASKTSFSLDPAKISQAFADKQKLDALTN